MRTIPSLLAADISEPGKTECYLLKIRPITSASVFGVTSLNRDVVYDDGTVDGEITYRSATGYSPFDVTTRADMSVDNSQAESLLAQYPIDGMTIEAVNRGDYDGARFVQYLVNYLHLAHGHTVINSGQVGIVTQVDELACTIELRSLTQVLKQISMVELTSITCRAKFGDERCKMPLTWFDATVASIGAEADRTFVIDPAPAENFTPGLVHFDDGDNEGFEREVESYDQMTGTVVLAIPAPYSIAPDDALRIRRDCDKSKAACIAYGNLPNMRAEPEMPRGEGVALQTPEQTLPADEQ